MINFTKSQPAPTCLAVEKAKNGDYKCGDVLTRLNDDFHRKCYICEDKDLTSINVEHLIPHRGNVDLKFDWDNLCLACYHCNNIKLAVHDDILNCVSNTIIITKSILFQTDGFPEIRRAPSLAVERKPDQLAARAVAARNQKRVRTDRYWRRHVRMSAPPAILPKHLARLLVVTGDRVIEDHDLRLQAEKPHPHGRTPMSVIAARGP